MSHLSTQLCLLDCPELSDAAFDLNEPRLSTDSAVQEGSRCLSPAPGYEALVWGLPYNFPGDLL